MFKKRIKLTLISSTTGKKLEKIKFSKEESAKIRSISRILNMSEQQVMELAIKNLMLDLRKYSVDSLSKKTHVT
jgi:hypothetical protein